MARYVPPFSAVVDAEVPRCPRCGSGELFRIDVTRPDNKVWQGAYCAGVYDRERRRFLRRSCGYAGPGRVALDATSEEPLLRTSVAVPFAG